MKEEGLGTLAESWVAMGCFHRRFHDGGCGEGPCSQYDSSGFFRAREARESSNFLFVRREISTASLSVFLSP